MHSRVVISSTPPLVSMIMSLNTIMAMFGVCILRALHDSLGLALHRVWGCF